MKRIITSAAVISTIAGMFFIGTLQVKGAGATPTVEFVFISSAAYAQSDSYSGGIINNLIAGGTKTIHINGIVQDTDGRDDIDSVDAVFYRSSVAGGPSCTTDKNNCYRKTGCSLRNNLDLDQKEYDCLIDLEYWIDSTVGIGRFPSDNWQVEVTVSDGELSDTDTSVTKEVQVLLALTIPPSVSFGTMGLGAKTTVGNNVESIISQAGNDEADLEVKMTDGNLTCGSGLLPRGNIEWALTDVAHSDGASTDLTGINADTDINVLYRDDDATNSTRTLYWNMEVPLAGVGGVCSSSNLVLTAKPH